MLFDYFNYTSSCVCNLDCKFAKIKIHLDFLQKKIKMDAEQKMKEIEKTRNDKLKCLFILELTTFQINQGVMAKIAEGFKGVKNFFNFKDKTEEKQNEEFEPTEEQKRLIKLC